MSVALLAVSSFGTLILLSSNIDPPVKFLTVITKLCRKLIFFYRNNGELRFGVGGNGWWEHRIL